MLSLLRNLECYTPKYIGKKDILICGEKIIKIQPDIKPCGFIDAIYECGGLYAFPGLVDQHVHIIGGGGEEGYQSGISEIEIDKILKSGITTLVGLLGADSSTKSLRSLYAKAKKLEAQGLTTYLYSGSYTVPPVTITKDLIHDLVFIDKVIGVKTSISDHRSSHPGIHEIIKIASDAHLGGLLSGKAGVVHIHIGDGKNGLSPLYKILKESDLSVEQFVPTHLNRNPDLFEQAVEYCRFGGKIDLTAGEKNGLTVPDAVSRLLIEGIDMKRITVSSDANGSMPNGGVSGTGALYDDIRNCIVEKGISPETAFSLVTENPSETLKLRPEKGTLSEGGDADILITDKGYHIKKLFCRGNLY